jgi:hypothetical protein
MVAPAFDGAWRGSNNGPAATGDQRHHEHHDEDEEQDPSDRHRLAFQTKEAQGPRDQSKNQKGYGPLQHGSIRSKVFGQQKQDAFNTT